MEAAGPETLMSLGSNTSLVLVLSILALVVYLYTSRWRGFQGWEKFGVKQVDHKLTDSLAIRNKILMKEHGPTVGIVRGVPLLVTRDLDLLKQILVKDFNSFVNRNDYIPSKSLLGKGVFFLKDYDWKRIRQLMSPSFSTGKLKRISLHVQEAANQLSRAFQRCARSGSHLKLLHTTGQYSTSIIAKTAFGVQTNSIGEEEDDQFTYSARNIFKKPSKFGRYLTLVLLRFRSLRTLLLETLNFSVVDVCTKKSSDYFNAVLKESIAEREKAVRQGSPLNNDFLQSLVSTKIASEASQPGDKRASLSNGTAGHGKENGPVPPKKTITTNEVIAQSLITILAAYETTASTLQFSLFKIAQNRDIQEKIFQEIQDVVQHENPTPEELAKLQYTEKVLNETLRLFPPVTRISRRASEDRTYGKITIPAGAAVEVPIREIHRDPTNYPDPELFDPERFSEDNRAKRHPLSFIPFGQGPRLCIGMRLAYLELKIALVQVLRAVELELTDTTVPPKGEDLEMDYTFFPRATKVIELAVKIREDQV